MTANAKRVVFTMGGKGGVGKTGVMVALAEWFLANEIPVTLLDLDTENKARGSLKHFFNGTVTKVNSRVRKRLGSGEGAGTVEPLGCSIVVKFKAMIDLSQMEEMLCPVCKKPFMLASVEGQRNIYRFEGCECNGEEFYLPEAIGMVGVGTGPMFLVRKKTLT